MISSGKAGRRNPFSDGERVRDIFLLETTEKCSFTKQDYGVFICFLLCIYTFMWTVLMLNQLTYSHEYTFNRRNQDYH